MRAWKSPLRYPGGKYKLNKFVKQILHTNQIDGTYIEAFAGGAGIAINLLLTGEVQRIVLNDLDIAVYSFWWTITHENQTFLQMFDSVQVNISEWHHQKNIFNVLSAKKAPFSKRDLIRLGFATYFLNRTNFSGILRGATPIGGLQQTGAWKINCQFNKDRLRPLLELIGNYSDYIIVSHFDMIKNFDKLLPVSIDKSNALVFFDPPYVREGRRLYLPIKQLKDHALLSRNIQESDFNWLLTYDLDNKLLPMYNNVQKKYKYQLRYYVKKKRYEFEFLAIADNLSFPNNPQLSNCVQL